MLPELSVDDEDVQRVEPERDSVKSCAACARMMTSKGVPQHDVTAEHGNTLWKYAVSIFRPQYKDTINRDVSFLKDFQRQ